MGGGVWSTGHGRFQVPRRTGSSHLGTRETGFTGATGFTRRTFGTSRARSTTFASRTLSGEKSQTHQGHSLGLISMGWPLLHAGRRRSGTLRGDWWGCQREAKREEEGDTVMGAGGREHGCRHECRWM